MPPSTRRRRRHLRRRLALAAALALGVAPRPAAAERLKELTTLVGARSNQLLGYGLVVGLENSGDSYYAGIGMQSVSTMLRHLGVQSDPNFLRLRNVASVMVIAEQPAFAAPGQRIDVTVSSIGDARTLEGGTLLASPLKGSDLRVYAVAQGPLAVGGFSASGLSRSRLQKNFTTVGRIPGGASIERDVPVDLPQERMSISLRSPDFTTAVRIGEAIDTRLRALGAGGTAAAGAGGGAEAGGAAPAEPWAVARDSGTVLVRVPPNFLGRIPKLMAELEAVEVNPDWITRVVINERTGTVVLGDATRLAPVAIAHGGLTLEVREAPVVSQPGPFAGEGAQTRVVQRTTIAAQESVAPLRDLSPGASLGEVVKALNTLGVSPRDMVSILQALKASGALRADLEIL